MTVGTETQLTKRSDLRSADEALLDANPTELLVCTIFEDQRPLKGVAGALDWRLKGFLSRFVMSGRITGAHEEFVYVPIKHQGAIRHLLLVGLGAQSPELTQESSDAKSKDSEALLTNLARRVSELKFKKIAVSRSSFPFLEASRIKKALKGVDVEFTQ